MSEDWKAGWTMPKLDYERPLAVLKSGDQIVVHGADGRTYGLVVDGDPIPRPDGGYEVTVRRPDPLAGLDLEYGGDDE